MRGIWPGVPMLAPGRLAASGISLLPEGSPVEGTGDGFEAWRGFFRAKIRPYNGRKQSPNVTGAVACSALMAFTATR